VKPERYSTNVDIFSRSGVQILNSNKLLSYYVVREQTHIVILEIFRYLLHVEDPRVEINDFHWCIIIIPFTKSFFFFRSSDYSQKKIEK